MAEIGLKTSFGEANEKYAKFRPTYPKELISVILENVKKPYKNALDIGAGTGISTKLLSEVFENVTALEPDKRMLASGSFNDNVNAINECAENAELEENAFDLITAANSFYWMEADVILGKMHDWLQKDGVIAAYRYNLPLTNDSKINQIIIYESEYHWDKFRHERLKDTEYTYRNIKNSPLFCNVQLVCINNVIALEPDELVGFFASTSYGNAYLKSIYNPKGYLAELTDKIKEISNGTKINTDFSIELVLAKKKIIIGKLSY